MRRFLRKCTVVFIAVAIIGSCMAFVYAGEAQADSDDGIVVYAAPTSNEDIKNNLNDWYQVKVRPSNNANAEWQSVDVYKTHLLLYQWQVAGFASFDSNVPVEVQVTVADKTADGYPFANLTSASVYPQAKASDVTLDADKRTITFTVDEPAQLIVEPNENGIHPLHLFVNPLENAADKEFGDKSVAYVNETTGIKETYDEDVIYVEPGYYQQDITLKNNQTMYLSGGAVINGCVNMDGIKNAKLFGRGILEQPAGRGLSIDSSENITVEGIVVNKYGAGDNGGCFANIGNSKNVTLDNIKGIGHNKWSDGIDIFTSDNVTIKDCFVRSTDDCIAVYGPRPNGGHLYWGETGDCKNLTVTGCVLAPDTAHSINIGTHGDYTSPNGGRSIDNLYFNDIDIITHNDGSSANPPLTSSLGISDGGMLTNVYFDDIRIDDRVVNRIMELKVSGNAFSTGANNGRGLKNAYFKDISYNNPDIGSLSSSISGYNGSCTVEDVTFENLKINGTAVTNAADAKFDIGSNVSNVNFVESGASSYRYNPAIVSDDEWPVYYNYAAGKTVSADSAADGYNASNVLDGSSDTSWRAGDSDAGHYILIDLGETRDISGGFLLTWEKSDVFYRYTIETSTDGETWTTRIDKADNKDTNRVQWDRVINTSPVNARYVRVTAKSVTDIYNGENTAGISEIEVLGTKNYGNDTVSTDAVKPTETSEKLTSGSGTIGDNITWDVENGILTLTGNGAMADVSSWLFENYAIDSIVIDDGITSIASYVFGKCTAKSVTFTSGMTSIDNYAFYGCKNLESVVFNGNDASIGKYAFANCTCLSTVTLSGVTSIGEKAFANCSSLEKIYLSDDNISVGKSAFPGQAEIIINGQSIGPSDVKATAETAAQIRGDGGWTNQNKTGSKIIGENDCIETTTDGQYFGGYYYFDIDIPEDATVTSATLTVEKCLLGKEGTHTNDHSGGFKNRPFNVAMLDTPADTDDTTSIWTSVSSLMTSESKTTARISDSVSGDDKSPLVGDVKSVIRAGADGIALFVYNATESDRNRPLSGNATLEISYTTESASDAVAEIGITTYSSLADAIKAAEDGDTIKLLRNVTLTERIIESGKSFTLYGNGKTINNAGYVMEFTDGSSITVDDLTITGSNRLNIPGTSSLVADNLTVTNLQFGGNYGSLKGTVKNSTVENLTAYGSVILNNTAVKNLIIPSISSTSDQPVINADSASSIANTTLQGVNSNAVLPYTLFSGELVPDTITITPSGYEYSKGVISKAENIETPEPTAEPTWAPRPTLNPDIKVNEQAEADEVNETFQYHFAGGTDAYMSGESEEGKKYDAYLWVPKDVKPGELRGLVAVKMNLIEVPFVNSETLRTSLADEDFGILFLVFQRDATTRYNTTFSNFNTRKDYAGNDLYSDTDTVDNVNVFTSDGKDASDIMNDILKGIANSSGYTEIEEKTPLITIGHSAAAPFGYRSGNWNPNRIIAQIQLKNGMGAPLYQSNKGMVPGIPSLQYAAQYTEHAVGADRDRSVRDARWLITNQRSDTNMLVSHIIEWGSGHYDWSDNMTDMLIKYIKKAIEYRLPDNYDGTNLNDLTSGGYLMKAFEKDGNSEREAGYYQANSWLSSGQNNSGATDADKKASFWYFDEDFANYVNGYTAYAIPESPDSTGTGIAGKTYSDTEPFMLMKDPSKSTQANTPAIASNVISPYLTFASNPFSRYGSTRFVDYDKLANPSANASNTANLGGYDIATVDTYYMCRVPTITFDSGKEAYDGSGGSVSYPVDTKAEFVPLMAPYEVVSSELLDMSDMKTDGTSEAENVVSVTRTKLRFHNNRVYYTSGCAATNAEGTSQDSFGMIVSPEIRGESGVMSSFKAVSSQMNVPYVTKGTQQTLTLDKIADVDIGNAKTNPIVDVTYLSSDSDLQKYTDVFVEYGPAKAVRTVNEDGSYSWQIEVLLDEIPDDAIFPIEVKAVASNLGKWETTYGATDEKIFYITNSGSPESTEEPMSTPTAEPTAEPTATPTAEPKEYLDLLSGYSSWLKIEKQSFDDSVILTVSKDEQSENEIPALAAYVAVYDDSGMLQSAKKYDFSANTVTLPRPDENYKIFIWTGNLQPVVDGITKDTTGANKLFD